MARSNPHKRPAAPGCKALLGALALALTMAAAPRAFAQSLRPNILIIFDTSGSMLNGDGEDGSPLCGGNGTDSRFYAIKQALRDALAQVGDDEANFGLARFAQVEDPTTDPQCSRGHYNVDITTSVPSGSCNGNCFTDSDCHCGCKLSGHNEETTYDTWFDTDFRQAILVHVTREPAGLKPVAADFDPLGANIAEVYEWIDMDEDADMTAPIDPPELRTGGGFYTPLGRSLFYSRMYFDNFVKPTDPKIACRPNIVILATDGAETCDGNASGGATLDLVTCAQTGLDSFHPQLQACQLFRQSSIKTYVLTDSTLTGDNDPIALAGGTGASIGVSLTDSAAVREAFIGIIAEAVPPGEVCNGLDDNCNNLKDEGVSNLCPFNATTLAHCAVEACNCLDDDCNGTVDDGFPLDSCGKSVCCTSPVELCNNVDDDCDGDVDETFTLGGSCTNGQMGACLRYGIIDCKVDGTAGCDAPPGTPGMETCNCLDDDCDGMTDELPLPPPVGDVCGVDIGLCTQGHYVCRACKLECDSMMMSMPEICDGIDNDCNGIIDDGMFPEVGMECTCMGQGAKAGVGECKKGKKVCKASMGIVCEGCGFPIPELCDKKDNDCDGKTDFEAPCKDGFTCMDGQCALPCSPGEFKCPPCFKCSSESFCIKQLCCGVTCEPGWHCDEETGTCKDPCAAVTCETPKVCREGVCLDCNTLGCADGEKCVAGVCMKDPCLGVQCAVNEYCNNGTCVGLCQNTTCPAGEACIGGRCQADRCAGVACPKTQFCDPADGQCRDNPCLTKQCGPGQACVSTTGTCETNPCLLINCFSSCFKCQVSAGGLAQCVADEATCKRTAVDAGGGGGCGCDLGAAPAPRGWALLALCGLALLRRRR